MSKALSGSHAAIPRQYCIWCEEKPAVPVHFPYCSDNCKRLEKKAKQHG
jgi:hypothetical protein